MYDPFSNNLHLEKCCLAFKKDTKKISLFYDQSLKSCDTVNFVKFPHSPALNVFLFLMTENTDITSPQNFGCDMFFSF